MTVTSYAAHPDVVAEAVPEGVLLIDMRSGDYFTLEDVGARVWGLCDGSRTIDEVVAVVASEYDAPAEEIAADVAALVAELVETGLLVAA